MHVDAQALLGRTGSASTTVSPECTAIAAGSGDLPVLATPRLAALMEEAACEALESALPDDSTTVGTHVDIRHVAPSPLGSDVTATAIVTSVEGSRVRFEVAASHTHHGATVEVGRGTHVRVVVDRERFLSDVQRRAGT